MIRLLLVEGDGTRLEWLAQALRREHFDIVGRATTGAEAVRQAGLCRPQVAAIALDLPDISGSEATRRIMEAHPVPIVLLLPRGSRERVDPAVEGARSGATTVLDAPPEPGDARHAEGLRELVTTLTLMHEVPVVQRRRPRRGPTPDSPLAGPRRRSATPEIVGMAASTGGPATVQTILTRLPEDFALPILLVQHMSDGFSPAMVDWLDRTTPLRVVAGRDGDTPRPGHVYVASCGQHLVLAPGPVLSLVDGPPVAGHRPSATVLLRSLAEVLGASAVGVLLTGMGDDGVDGLLEIRRRGGVTLAQDEETCVVYGMPGEAQRRGAVQCSLPPREIAATLLRLARGSGGPAPVEPAAS